MTVSNSLSAPNTSMFPQHLLGPAPFCGNLSILPINVQPYTCHQNSPGDHWPVFPFRNFPCLPSKHGIAVTALVDGGRRPGFS